MLLIELLNSSRKKETNKQTNKQTNKRRRKEVKNGRKKDNKKIKASNVVRKKERSIMVYVRMKQ